MTSNNSVQNPASTKRQLNPMDLYDVQSELSEEERMVQETVARFVDEKVIPVIRDAFENHYFPRDLIPRSPNSVCSAALSRATTAPG